MTKTNIGEITALYQWGLDKSLDQDTCVRLAHRGLQAAKSEAQRKIEWWQDRLKQAEEEMTAIEESTGIFLDEDLK